MRTQSTLSSSSRPRVVIIGAGFGGLNAAKALRRAPVEVVMIDRNNYHTFQPLLYQVATAGLDMGDIAHQVRDIFRRQRNFRFRQGTVVGIDWQQKRVLLQPPEESAIETDSATAGTPAAAPPTAAPHDAAVPNAISFDYLIIAAGASYHDFGIPGVREHAFVLKSLEGAVNLRSHILAQFERASADPALVDEGILDVVIVGAGPTGVEMAGALQELFRRVLPHDYPELDVGRARVILLEAADRVLAPYSPRSSAYAQRVLERRGVDVRLGTAVAEVRAGNVVLASGEIIPTGTLIWAAGVRGHPLAEKLGVALERGHRVAVEDDLSLPGRPYAFVVGDLAGARDPGGRLYPQVAQVAIQQGKHAARTILRRLDGLPGPPFRYADRGIMAIIGRDAGIAELSPKLGGLRLRGFLGWLGWLFIHLIYLPGHQNRFHALANWAYNYFTFDRHARLITYMRTSSRDIAPSNEARRRSADGVPQPQPTPQPKPQPKPERTTEHTPS